LAELSYGPRARRPAKIVTAKTISIIDLQVFGRPAALRPALAAPHARQQKNPAEFMVIPAREIENNVSVIHNILLLQKQKQTLFQCSQGSLTARLCYQPKPQKRIFTKKHARV
jgi:hypothetical protein